MQILMKRKVASAVTDRLPLLLSALQQFPAASPSNMTGIELVLGSFIEMIVRTFENEAFNLAISKSRFVDRCFAKNSVQL